MHTCRSGDDNTADEIVSQPPWAAFGLLVAAAPCSHHMRRRCLPAQLPSCMQRRASAPRCMCPAMDGMDHGPVPTADGARCTMATGVDGARPAGRRAVRVHACMMHKTRSDPPPCTAYSVGRVGIPTVQRTLQRTVGLQ
jgi:hypothetical protein